MFIVFVLFFWVVLTVQKGLCRPENGHFMDDILWFPRASWFVVFSSCVVYALVHAIVLWQLLCPFLCSGVHQSCFCALLIVFLQCLLPIKSGSLHFLLFSVFCFLVCCCMVVLSWLACSIVVLGATMVSRLGFGESWLILAIGLGVLFSLLSQCLGFDYVCYSLVDSGVHVIDSSLPMSNCFFGLVVFVCHCMFPMWVISWQC